MLASSQIASKVSSDTMSSGSDFIFNNTYVCFNKSSCINGDVPRDAPSSLSRPPFRRHLLYTELISTASLRVTQAS